MKTYTWIRTAFLALFATAAGIGVGAAQVDCDTPPPSPPKSGNEVLTCDPCVRGRMTTVVELPELMGRIAFEAGPQTLVAGIDAAAGTLRTFKVASEGVASPYWAVPLPFADSRLVAGSFTGSGVLLGVVAATTRDFVLLDPTTGLVVAAGPALGTVPFERVLRYPGSVRDGILLFGRYGPHAELVADLTVPSPPYVFLLPVAVGGSFDLRVADVDGGGLADLVAYGPSPISILSGESLPRFALAGQIPVAATAVTIADRTVGVARDLIAATGNRLRRFEHTMAGPWLPVAQAYVASAVLGLTEVGGVLGVAPLQGDPFDTPSAFAGPCDVTPNCPPYKEPVCAIYYRCTVGGQNGCHLWQCVCPYPPPSHVVTMMN